MTEKKQSVSLENANEKYNEGEYEEAAKIYKELANKGNEEAAVKYCKMLENNNIISNNKEEKAKLYNLAADHYLTKKMTYESAIENKNSFFVKIMFDEQLIFDTKLTNEKTNKKIEEKYENIVKECNELLVKYYRKAAHRQNPDAMFMYAQILEEGIVGVIKKNKEKSMYYYEIAASKGNLKAMIKYSEMLENGIDVKENKKEAAKYYKLIADYYQNIGKDVLKKNKTDKLHLYYNKQMLIYFKKAAKLGSKEAKDKLEEYNKQNTLKQDKFKNIPVQQKPKSILINDKSKPKEESLEDIRKSLVENYSKNIDRYIKAIYKEACLLEKNNNKRAAVKYYKTVLKYCKNKSIRNLQISDKITINTNNLKNKIDELDSVNIKIGIAKNLKDQEVAKLIKTQLEAKYGFKFKEELGAGTEGIAYLVEKDGREFVVKIPKWSNGYYNSESSKEEIEEKNDIINLNKLGFTTVKDTINLKINGKAVDVQIEIYEKKIDLKKTIHNYAKREKFKPFAFTARSLLNLNNLHNISNIVHMDLKPANMLFSSDYLPELADFGFSESMGNVNSYVGSGEFKPIELLNKSTVNNIKTDVYSMGASIYEAFTGEYFYKLLDTGEREKINDNNYNWLIVDYAKNIDKKITKENIIDKIDFTTIFPNVNFINNNKISRGNLQLLSEVKTELLEFFKGTLTANHNARFTTNEAIAQFRKVLKKCQKMKKKNGKNLDLTEDLGIPEQDLYRYGIFNDKIVGTAKNDYIDNIKNLLYNDLNLVSEETIKCLKTLLNNANKEEININFDDNFRKNLETLKEKDKTKYLLITKEIIELKKLKLASKINELKKEKNKFKKNVENVQELEKVREYRRKLKELYNMSDMIIKIKQNKKMAKHLLCLKFNDKITQFRSACADNNIFAVKVLLNSANKKEKEAMIKNINVCYGGKNTILYNLLNKSNMDKNDIRDAEFLIANGANFGSSIPSYDSLPENIKNNIKNNLRINVKEGKNYNLNSVLNFISNHFKNKNLNVLSDNLEELKDIDKLLGIDGESKTVTKHR